MESLLKDYMDFDKVLGVLNLREKRDRGHRKILNHHRKCVVEERNEKRLRKTALPNIYAAALHEINKVFLVES